MKVIRRVCEREFEGKHYVEIANYYIRGLVWHVWVHSDKKDLCDDCDLSRLNECCVVCGGPDAKTPCKCVHEGDVLVSEKGRVYIVVKEGLTLRSRLATSKDLDSDRQLRRISPGVYLYRGHWIRDLGYYEPDKKVVWEAEPVNNQALGVPAHGFSLRDCLTELRMALGEGDYD